MSNSRNGGGRGTRGGRRLVADRRNAAPAKAPRAKTRAPRRGRPARTRRPRRGGILGAINGTLTFMVGGEKEEFERSKEVLSGMGTNIFHCGGPGTGGIAKICNNLMLGINMMSCAEGM